MVTPMIAPGPVRTLTPIATTAPTLALAPVAIAVPVARGRLWLAGLSLPHRRRQFLGWIGGRASDAAGRTLRRHLEGGHAARTLSLDYRSRLGSHAASTLSLRIRRQDAQGHDTRQGRHSESFCKGKHSWIS